MRKHTAVGLLAALCMADMSAAHAELIVSNYFVRPALRVTQFGEIQDGITINGATTQTQVQGALGNSRSTVNLNDGTVKMYIESQGVKENLQTFGSFGERITITGGAGTVWNATFAIEGSMETWGGAPRINGVRDPLWQYDVGMAIYRPGVAAWDTFNSVALRTSADNLFYGFDARIETIDSDADYTFNNVFLAMNASIPLVSDYEVFDLFAFTNIIVDPDDGDGLIDYIADFENTARYSQTLADNVQAFSSSGSFLGLSTPPPVDNGGGPGVSVPVPASALLMTAGLLLVGRRQLGGRPR